MSNLKLIIVALFAANLFLLGLEASKPPLDREKEPENIPPQVDSLPTIRLLSELDDMDSRGDPGGQTGADPGQVIHQCFIVGPFEGRATVEAILELLAAHTTALKSRETAAFVDRGYWVYLPPYVDEQAARVVVNTLYDAGVEDVSLIRNGEWNNSISLGYFISQANAQLRKKQVREMGFDAETRIQREEEPRYWVDYEQQAGVGTASDILADMVPEGLHRETTCPQWE